MITPDVADTGEAVAADGGSPAAHSASAVGAPAAGAAAGDPAASRTRAEPMAPDERRAMIAEAAVPHYLEHGAGLSTRQLAEELGISEGTIFRAFGDKESLLRAVVDAFFTQGRARVAGGIVDPALPLDEKIAAIITGSRVWMRQVMRMVSLVGREQAATYFRHPHDDTYTRAIAAAFAPDADRLSVPPERLGAIMRIASMAAGVAVHGHDAALTDDELVHFILYGIAGAPRGTDA